MSDDVPVDANLPFHRWQWSEAQQRQHQTFGKNFLEVAAGSVLDAELKGPILKNRPHKPLIINDSSLNVSHPGASVPRAHTSSSSQCHMISLMMRSAQRSANQDP